MEVLRFRPLVVTFLLILLYGSGSLFVTGLSFISISIVATFICFIFKIQIDFEALFSFIEKLWHASKVSSRPVLKGTPLIHGSKNIEESDKGSPDVTPDGTLKDLPRPLARKLKLLIDGVMKDFVESWYIEICPEDEQFPKETRKALEQLAVEGYKRMCNMETHSAAVKLINLLTAHLKIFTDCRDAVNSKYPGINSSDFEKCITELYETRIIQHISAKSQGTSLDFLRKITDILMYVLLPKNAFSCGGGRFMLREVIAIQGLQRLVDLLSDPHFVNKALIDIFEESVPKNIILQQWAEESLKELTSSDDEKEDNESNDDKNMTSNFGNRIESDIYESASETGLKDLPLKMKKSRRTKTSSYSSVEQINELPENVDLKFATPRHSTTEWSSADESYNAFDRVLRQNQLEAKSSAPVYGSTMVKLHEKSEHSKVPNLPFQIPVSIAKQNLIVAKADSGVSSTIVTARSSSLPLSQVDKLDEEKKKEGSTTRKIKHKSKHYRKIKKQRIESEVNGDVQSKVLTLHEENSAEAWSNCPPSDSNYYRKVSYNEMDRRQDLLHEQFKAKLNAMGSSLGPVSCMKSAFEKNQIRKHRSLPDLKNSFEDSMVICHLDDYNESIMNAVFHENDKTVTDGSDGQFVKVHCVPERNAFYDVAPGCPTCIEMTSLANPKENGKAVLTFEPKQKPLKPVDHDCGLSISHFYYPELDNNETLQSDDDDKSFVSFDSNDSLTDLEESLSTVESESTLLASCESTGKKDSRVEVVDRPKIRRSKIEFNFDSAESFDVVSLKESDSEFSSIGDFDENDSKQNSFDSKDGSDDVEIRDFSMAHNRALSITTYASAFETSTHENDTHHDFKTPLTNKRSSQPFSNIVKKFKSTTSIKSKKHINQKTEIPAKILKSLKELTSRKSLRQKSESSDDDDDEIDFRASVSKKSTQGKYKQKKTMPKKQGLSLKIPSVNGKMEDKEETFDNSFSGTTDSTESCLKAHSFTPSNILPIDTMVNDWQQDALKVPNGMTEEIAHEIYENADYNETFQDARSLFGAGTDVSEHLTLESVDIERNSDLGEDASVVQNAPLDMKENVKGDWVIPIYEGEVVLPHPGKMPVSAWMYPVQMISIPSTEVAFEKGWEPGGNKYTLYSIHYDIRIWPEIYQKQMMEASLKLTAEGNTPDGIPIIREIKRRYREFMFLHNRLTHSQMSGYMKGVLRPNRRYGMPFGRMDPDVIEGRRKILETYLVSLVSRTEVCNSREFKEFLGAEGYSSVSFVKQKAIQPKQMVNKVIGNIKSAFPASKYAAEKGETSQYFIHGYDVPRMFGYSKDDALDRSSSPWFTSFSEAQKWQKSLPGEDHVVSSTQKKVNVIGKVEFFQKPKFIDRNPQEMEDKSFSESSMASKNADCPGPSQNGYFTENSDRRFSIGIPALFTNELAARSKRETLSTLDARKYAEEIPWPLSDAVMSFICQGLNGYNCWLTYENVQQAILYSLGSLLEWKLLREIDEIVIEERWMKYLNDLYHVIWEDGKLIEPPPEPTEEEKRAVKEQALDKMLDFLPSIVRIMIGGSEYRKWGEGLLHALQYKKINRHLLFAAIDLIMCEFIPELQDGFLEYKTASSSSN